MSAAALLRSLGVVRTSQRPPTSNHLPTVGALAARQGGRTAPHRRTADWARLHPTIMDTLLGFAFFALSLPTLLDPSALHYPENVRDGDVLGVVLLALMTLPLAVRRRYPVPVLLVTLGSTIPFLALNYADASGPLGGMIALYTVAAHRPREEARRVAIALFIPFVLLLLAGFVSEDKDLGVAGVISNSVVYWGAFGIGDAFRSRRAYVGELQLRVDTAELLRQEEAAAAVAHERTRIARELHDVVAHGMSVMVVQASAAHRVLEDRPDQAAEALTQIERVGRESMAEMRRLLGVLREDDGDTGTELAPQPGLGAVAALVASWAEAGLPVTLIAESDVTESDVDGEQAIPPGLDLAAYRIVQEALTNVHSHAGPVTEVRVRVERVDDAVQLTVTDDGRGAGAIGSDGGGFGLLGMRERAALYRGTVSAGPRPGGGWEVRAVLPLTTEGGPRRRGRGPRTRRTGATS